MKYKELTLIYKKEIETIKELQKQLNGKKEIRLAVITVNKFPDSLKVLERQIEDLTTKIAILKERLHAEIEHAYEDCPFQEVRKMGINKFYEITGV